MNPNKLTPGYNLMWESSRMMLPEHRERYLLKNGRKKYTPPPLSTDQLEEMNFLITQSITEDQAICVTYAEAGRKEQFWGWVKAIHYETRRIKIVNDEDVLNLSLRQIVAIDLD